MNGSDVVDCCLNGFWAVLVHDLVDLKSDKVIVAAGQMVTEEHAEAIAESGVDHSKSGRRCCVKLSAAFAPIVTVVTWPEVPM